MDNVIYNALGFKSIADFRVKKDLHCYIWFNYNLSKKAFLSINE